MMGHEGESQALFRIDIAPDIAGNLLAGFDKRDAEKLEDYTQLAYAGMIFDTGNLNEQGELVRTIIASKQHLDRFFPSYFHSSMPYDSKVLSQEDYINQMMIYEGRLNNSKNGGDIFVVGTGYNDARHKVYSPNGGNNYAYTP